MSVVVAVVVLSGCGDDDVSKEAGSDTAVPAAAAAHNDTDVMFLQMLIGHHTQGLEMSKLAQEKALRPEVQQLAAAITLTQAEEVKIMNAWLKGWKEQTAVVHDTTAHADHGGMPATGPEQIASLRETSGAEFDLTFLALMSGHQGAAAEMTNLVASGGLNPETKELARRVKESRQAQVAQMITLMNG